MEAQANFNRRTARTIDVDASALRNRLDKAGRPVVLRLRSASSRSRLDVYMTDKEALELAAELYAMSDTVERVKALEMEPTNGGTTGTAKNGDWR